jgi:hypothetical protein
VGHLGCGLVGGFNVHSNAQCFSSFYEGNSLYLPITEERHG